MTDRKPAITGTVSLVLTVLNAIGLIVSAAYSLHIRHACDKMFEEFDASVPAVTRILLGVHWSVWILLSMALLTFLILKELIPNKSTTLRLNIAFMLLGIVYWAMFSVTMLLPLTKLIQRL